MVGDSRNTRVPDWRALAAGRDTSQVQELAAPHIDREPPTKRELIRLGLLAEDGSGPGPEYVRIRDEIGRIAADRAVMIARGSPYVHDRTRSHSRLPLGGARGARQAGLQSLADLHRQADEQVAAAVARGVSPGLAQVTARREQSHGAL